MSAENYSQQSNNLPGHLLPISLLAKLRDLRLLAHLPLAGVLTGQQRSAYRGAGIEFNQYRHYEPGDDLRLLDWKLLARSDRLYSRESQRDSHLAVQWVIDASASMAETSDAAMGISKLHYARLLTGCMSYLACMQGDQTGLLALNKDHTAFLKPVAGLMHWQRLTVLLQQLKAQHSFPESAQLHRYDALMQQAGLVIIISDFFSGGKANNDILDLARRLQAAKREVWLLQLLTREEWQLDLSGVDRIKDRETGQEFAVSLKDKKSYQQLRDCEQQRLESSARNAGLELSSLFIDESLDAAVRAFVSQRSRAA